jgi:hypothetical protein
MTVHVFTSAAFNYIPKARLLFDSLRRHHPEWVLHLALGDALHPELDLSGEAFDSVMPLADLNIPNWRGWAFCHTIVELCTAIKPFALQRLLRENDCEKVFYFDPDIVLFSRVDDIVAALDDGNICLTPHLTAPEDTLQAVIDNEICSLQHGIYNLGFIGVRGSEEGRRFADWWASRAYHFCRDDIPHGLFTDQRWIDMAPAFFEGVAIMRSSRHNVAPWNISRRNLTGNLGDGFRVDSDPLGFYHFTGFDSGAHLGMSNRYAATNPSVFDLITWYVRRTEELGRDPIAGIRWAYDTYSNGEKITPAQRIVYRERIDLQAAFPDPFDANGFRAWWHTHGMNEYPKLFESQVSKETLSSSFAFTPGFRGGMMMDAECQETVQGAPMRRSPKQTILRGWEILRTGGLPRFARSRFSSLVRVWINLLYGTRC